MKRHGRIRNERPKNVVMPTHRPMVRKDQQDVVYRTKSEKWKAVADEIEEELQAYMAKRKLEIAKTGA